MLIAFPTLSQALRIGCIKGGGCLTVAAKTHRRSVACLGRPDEVQYYARLTAFVRDYGQEGRRFQLREKGEDKSNSNPPLMY